MVNYMAKFMESKFPQRGLPTAMYHLTWSLAHWDLSRKNVRFEGMEEIVKLNAPFILIKPHWSAIDYAIEMSMLTIPKSLENHEFSEKSIVNDTHFRNVARKMGSDEVRKPVSFWIKTNWYEPVPVLGSIPNWGLGKYLKSVGQIPVSSTRHIIEKDFLKRTGRKLRKETYDAIRAGYKSRERIDMSSLSNKSRLAIMDLLDNRGIDFDDFIEYCDFIDDCREECMRLTMDASRRMIKYGGNLGIYVTGTRAKKGKLQNIAFMGGAQALMQLSGEFPNIVAVVMASDHILRLGKDKGANIETKLVDIVPASRYHIQRCRPFSREDRGRNGDVYREITKGFMEKMNDELSEERKMEGELTIAA